jgi:hypothetical protein
MGNKCCGSFKKKHKSKNEKYLKEKISKLSNSFSKNETVVKSSLDNPNLYESSNANNNSFDSKVKIVDSQVQDVIIQSETVNENTACVSKINDPLTTTIRKEANNDLKNRFSATSTSTINYLGQDINLIRSKNKPFEDFYFLKTISSICESTESSLFLSIQSRFGCNSESGLKELNKLVKWQRTKVKI